MKSKKKLLLMGVGVMGALAMGVGATSTFAWYQASTTIKNAAFTGNHSVTVGQTSVYSAGTINVPLLVTATYDPAGLGLAHYSAKNAGAVPNDDDAEAPFLTTGYLDDGGTFHDLGYVDGTGAANLATFSPSITKLSDTMTISIDLDWAQWKKSDESAATTRDNADHIVLGGNTYTLSTVLGALDDLSVDVGIKSNSSRVRFFKTSAATGDVDLANMESSDKVNTDYAKAASGQSLAAIATGAVTVTSPTFYVYGGASNQDDSAGLTAQSVALWVGVGA